MNITPQEYARLNEQYSPNSKIGQNCLKAFLFGGAICAIAELFCEWLTTLGILRDKASVLASGMLIIAAVLLTALNMFDKLAKHAGAGTLVPITGFANSMASPAIEFKAEGLILGLGAKIFIVAGPVLTYGIGASVLYGLIIRLFGLY